MSIQIRTNGALIPNSDIILEVYSDNGNCSPYGGVDSWEVISAPTGSYPVITTEPGWNSDTGIFRTDMLGNYTVRAKGVEECGGVGSGGDEFSNYNTTLSFAVGSVGAGIAITQMILGDNETGECDKVGVYITASVEFNEINGVGIASTLTYKINKGREEILPITIKATNPGDGETTLTSRETVPYMGEVFAEGQYQDVTVTLAQYPNEYTYNFEVILGSFTPNNKYHFNPPASYTIRVKDKWGCRKDIYHTSTPLPVIDPTIVPDEFYVAKGNSFRYVDRSDQPFDDCANYKTDENVFDGEIEGLDINYCYHQRFKKCNDIITQFKSNFENHTAQYWNLTTGAGPFPMTINSVQQNLLVQDSRSYLRKDDSRFSYIYFTNGLLPYFYEVGGNCTINGEQRRIFAFDELEEENALALRVELLTAPGSGEINYTYNRQNYDVYEFTTPLSSLGSGEYYIQIDATKIGSEPKQYLTPTWFLENSWEQTFDFMYYNTSSTDIFYGSGIRNFLTVGFEWRKPQVDASLSVVNADYTNYLTSSFNIEKFEVKFEPMSLENMRKLVIALCHEKLFIGSVGYAVENIEIDVAGDYTNLYSISAVMSKSNQNVRFVAGAQKSFTWASGNVTFDNRITFDRTTYGT